MPPSPRTRDGRLEGRLALSGLAIQSTILRHLALQVKHTMSKVHRSIRSLLQTKIPLLGAVVIIVNLILLFILSLVIVGPMSRITPVGLALVGIMMCTSIIAPIGVLLSCFVLASRFGRLFLVLGLADIPCCVISLLGGIEAFSLLLLIRCCVTLLWWGRHTSKWHG